MNHSLYVDCYNCTGVNTTYMCGMPCHGCELCQTYGQGHGRLLSEYRHKVATIGDQTYHPPSYTCLTCKDTQKTKFKVWDERLIDRRCSDLGVRMPWVTIACSECQPEISKVERETASRNQLASYVCPECQNQKQKLYPLDFDTSKLSKVIEYQGKPHVWLPCKTCDSDKYNQQFNDLQHHQSGVIKCKNEPGIRNTKYVPGTRNILE